MADIEVGWREDFDSRDVEALHAEAFGHKVTAYDWFAQVQQHSLGWAVARHDDAVVGFMNVAWDGGSHAFVLDPVVAPREGRQGLGGRMVDLARRESATAGCEWLHVDFDDHLRPFYFDACGFTPTNGGVLLLNARSA